jgi:hypothetical protein
MSLITQLKQISDHRHIKGRRHPLWMLLCLSLLGFLCGYSGYRPLEDFCRKHERELRVLLELPRSQAMPSYSTFRRSFLETDPEAWIAVFNVWSLANLSELPASLLSIDGKSIRATSTGGSRHQQNFVSLVSLYGQQVGVLQLLMMENNKCSEIHVAQALIEQLPSLPPGQCFSLDALHTTQATIKVINQTEQDYLLPVKLNRPYTHAEIEDLIQVQTPVSTASEQDDSHGRIVHRQVEVFEPTPKLKAQFPRLKTVGRVHRVGVRLQEAFSETVYYLSSRNWLAEDLLNAVRQHWQIENGLHWVKDVLFKEDTPDRRGGNAPINWAIFNTFGITLARRQGFRTIPQALRSWANSLKEVFHFVV